MNDNDVVEIILFCIRTLCVFISIQIFIDFFRKLRALKRATISQFFVKTAFAFERDGSLVGTLTYYTEADIQRELLRTQLELADYVREYLPNMNLPIESVCASDLNKAGIKMRAVIKKEIVDKYQTLVIPSEHQLVIINCMGHDPRVSWWFGTCLVSNNEEVIKIAMNRFRKVKKNDPTCHVVRT